MKRSRQSRDGEGKEGGIYAVSQAAFLTFFSVSSLCGPSKRLASPQRSFVTSPGRGKASMKRRP